VFALEFNSLDMVAVPNLQRALHMREVLTRDYTSNLRAMFAELKTHSGWIKDRNNRIEEGEAIIDSLLLFKKQVRK